MCQTLMPQYNSKLYSSCEISNFRDSYSLVDVICMV